MTTIVRHAASDLLSRQNHSPAGVYHPSFRAATSTSSTRVSGVGRTRNKGQSTLSSAAFEERKERGVSLFPRGASLGDHVFCILDMGPSGRLVSFWPLLKFQQADLAATTKR